MFKLLDMSGSHSDINKAKTSTFGIRSRFTQRFTHNQTRLGDAEKTRAKTRKKPKQETINEVIHENIYDLDEIDSKFEGS